MEFLPKAFSSTRQAGTKAFTYALMVNYGTRKARRGVKSIEYFPRRASLSRRKASIRGFQGESSNRFEAFRGLEGKQ